MADALSYSILNKIFRLLQTAVDVEDTVTIESKSINIMYSDVKAGRLYPVYISSLPDRCCLIHSQLLVVTPFSTSTNPVLYAQFNLGVDIQEKVAERGNKSKYGLIYNGLDVSTPGIKTPNGILMQKQKSRIINYGKNDLVAYFSLLGAWSVAPDITHARAFPTGSGNANSALVVGGIISTNNYITSSEHYNGSAWSMGAVPPRNVYYSAAAGEVISNSMVFGGFIGANNATPTDSLSYNGAAWSVVAVLPVKAYGHAGTGKNTAALSVSGHVLSVGYSFSTYEYANSVWTQSADVNIARGQCSACGSLTSALLVGGYNSFAGAYYATEEYNGVSWTLGNDLCSSRKGHACSGTISSALVSNGTGETNNWSQNAEEYDGTTWLTTGKSLHFRVNGAGAGANASSCLDITGQGYPTGESYWAALENVERYSKSNLYNLTAGQITLYLTYCYT